MRTREEELSFQVMDVFKEFYKEKLEDRTTCFAVTATELDKMISIEDVNEEDQGILQHNIGNFRWRFMKNKSERYGIIFIKVQNEVG
ncbi:MAG: hypothetical protein RR523_15645 [Cetobacterium sp.]|uniref:hypothetical protein n=1 Tax=Cetobacterium sp. TaxID=2071632 RepID=UPI002FCB8934